MTDHQKRRLGEKLVRLAYELEHDAARLREGAPDQGARNFAEGIKGLSSTAGNLGRRLRDGEA